MSDVQMPSIEGMNMLKEDIGHRTSDIGPKDRPRTSDIGPLLSIDGLRKTFTLHERGMTLSAVVGCSFDVHPGTLTALVGPSGAGKSSVLSCIFRTYRPSAGRIMLTTSDGPVDLASADDRAVLRLRTAHLAFVTQFLRCLPRQPALAVVAEPALLALGKDAAQERAASLLEHLGVPGHLWSLPPATFSGGEKQRVNLARGFCAGAPLLLLDEPTASLDPVSRERVVELISRTRDAGTAIVAVFHDADLVRRLADHTVYLEAAPC